MKTLARRCLPRLRRSSGDVDPESDEMDWEAPPPTPVVHTAPKVGRNDPCPSGSGKKHKKCCGK